MAVVSRLLSFMPRFSMGTDKRFWQASIVFHLLLFVLLLSLSESPAPFKPVDQKPLLYARTVSWSPPKPVVKKPARVVAKKAKAAPKRDVVVKKAPTKVASKKVVKKVAPVKPQVAKAKAKAKPKPKPLLAQKAGDLEAIARSRLDQAFALEEVAQTSLVAQSIEMEEKISAYVAQIRQLIESHWIKPQGGLLQRQLVLKVQLGHAGEVVAIETVQSSGDDRFDRQAKLAVQKSSPLPLPEDKAMRADFHEILLPFAS